VVRPGSKRLEFRFTALNLAASERVRFRYMLAPYEKDWVESGVQRTAFYNTLPPGDYVFRATASNGDGLWTQEPAAVRVSVLPYVWQTWWFQLLSYSAAATVLAVTVAFASRQRHHRKLENIERLRSLERERARIAQDMHDDLGASLTRISLLSQTATTSCLTNPQTAARYLDQIHSSTHDLIRAMDEIVWAVNPRHDTLESLLNYLTRFGHEFLKTANIRCRMDLPVDFPDHKVRSEIRHNVFLAFKEVRLSIRLESSAFELLIQDNGRGFEPSRFAAATSNASRLAAGNGLANMRNRLGGLGGAVTFVSGSGTGTCVSFRVPL
jgi:signal transduction histidine kinase